MFRSNISVLQRATASYISTLNLGNATIKFRKTSSCPSSRFLSNISSKEGKPQRSVLYLPGSNLKAIAKARTLPADMIVMDLEDAVAPDAKSTARKQVIDSLAEGFKNHPVVVRANGLDTPWGIDDLSALATAKGIHAIAIPKVEFGATLIKANKILVKAGAPQGLEIWCMIETPIGIFNLQEICSTGTSEVAGMRLSALVRLAPGRQPLCAPRPIPPRRTTRLHASCARPVMLAPRVLGRAATPRRACFRPWIVQSALGAACVLGAWARR